jgi:hypothetical protein
LVHCTSPSHVIHISDADPPTIFFPGGSFVPVGGGEKTRRTAFALNAAILAWVSLRGRNGVPL